MILSYFERRKQEKQSSAESKIPNGVYQISTREGPIKIEVKESNPILSKEAIEKLSKIYEAHELELPEDAYLMRTDFGLFLLLEVSEKWRKQNPVGPSGDTGGRFMPVPRRRTHLVVCEYLMTPVV